jgi:hypothetical protein
VLAAGDPSRVHDEPVEVCAGQRRLYDVPPLQEAVDAHALTGREQAIQLLLTTLCLLVRRLSLLYTDAGRPS